VPGLALGGVHGRNEKKVYEKLCDLVDEWIEIYGEDAAIDSREALLWKVQFASR
jgi:hypothetical protein